LCAVLMATSAFGLKWMLVGPLGPGGVAWATVVSYSVFTFVPLTLVVHRAKQRFALVESDKKVTVMTSIPTTEEDPVIRTRA